MTAGAAVRVLVHDPARGLRRAAIDWIADRLAHARVVVPAAARAGADFPARVEHPPFAPPDPAAARLAADLVPLLSTAAAGSRAWAIEAAVLALFEGAPLVAADTATFRDLTALSSWSMNVPERPTDGLLVQHLGIAGRLPAAFLADADESLAALLEGNPQQLAEVARTRRRRAREDGPIRFRRIAKTSAGLRPFVIYLDLFPVAAAARAAGPALAERLGALGRETALALFSTAAAIFI